MTGYLSTKIVDTCNKLSVDHDVLVAIKFVYQVVASKLMLGPTQAVLSVLINWVNLLATAMPNINVKLQLAK